MSVASSSALRILRTQSGILPAVRYASTSSESYNQQYVPRPYRRDHDHDSLQPPSRPPRPSSPVFFTGKPAYSAAVSNIEATLKSTLATLRADFLYPLPRLLSLPPAPDARWRTRDDMKIMFNTNLGPQEHRRISDLLNELNRSAYLADLAGKTDLADKVYGFLSTYSRKEIVRVKKEKKKQEIDEFGRAHGAGRRKTATARVWIIPSQSALSALDVPIDPHGGRQRDEIIPSGDFLVNHLPLPSHFTRPVLREQILRPLRITGLLGAYNVFALVHGGGESGQAGAVALALAKALTVMREDTRDVLYADGALKRDPRSVERKKTNLLSARAARAWVKR